MGCCVAELKKHGFDHTNSARRCRLEGSWEPGEGYMARSGDFGWAGAGIWARGKGLETSQKVNLGRQWLETEDEGKSSCEKLRAVLGVLLVVAVCPNTPFKKITSKQT